MSKENEEPQFAKALLDMETLSEMLTTEFLVKGYIASHVNLEVKEMELGDNLLELTLLIHEGYIH